MNSSQHSVQQLTALGFTTSHATLPNGQSVEYILPPLCDVPSGSFLMGSDPALDAAASADEQPQHHVDVAAFQIARYPVTVAEYACFVRAGHPAPPPQEIATLVTWELQQRLGYRDDPVVCINWYDALQYAAWLAELTGQLWRLPTEAEWEKAARWDVRAGTSRTYPWGNDYETMRCNDKDSGCYLETSHVGRFPQGASPCGADDMAGNVWEWTSSLYRPYPYEAMDGREDQQAAGERMARGGSYASPSAYVRSACRIFHDAPDDDDSSMFAGCRLVRSVPRVSS